MKILVATVGGNPAPILRAWRAVTPDLTVFICSMDDLDTGHKGSYTQVEDTRAPAESLSGILALTPQDYAITLVPADDLTAAYRIVKALLAQLHTDYPEAVIQTDYTGGTKSMSACLVLASLERDYVQLSVVTGARNDLIKVVQGTESLRLVNLGEVQVQREMEAMLQHWRTFSYEAAEAGLNALLDGLNMDDLKRRVTYGRLISRAFQLWDRFQHQDALKVLSIYDRVMTPTLRAYQIDLKELTHTTPSPKLRFLQLWDLWLNAERRAAQRRYDDAIGRCYRLVEASGQWVLSFYQVNTAAVNPETLGPEICGQLAIDRDAGPYKFGLVQTWQLASLLHDGPLATAVQDYFGVLQNLLAIRNHSLCAHGFDPISEPEWQLWDEWLHAHFIPALQQEAQALGIKRFPQQFPRSIEDVSH